MNLLPPDEAWLANREAARHDDDPHPCDQCDGSGEHVTYADNGDPQLETTHPCRECDGTGTKDGTE